METINFLNSPLLPVPPEERQSNLNGTVHNRAMLYRIFNAFCSFLDCNVRPEAAPGMPQKLQNQVSLVAIPRLILKILHL